MDITRWRSRVAVLVIAGGVLPVHAAHFCPPPIEVQRFEVSPKVISPSEKLYLFENLSDAPPPLGKLVLIRQNGDPLMAFRVLRSYSKKKRFIGKRIKVYPNVDGALGVGDRFEALLKIADRTVSEEELAQSCGTRTVASVKQPEVMKPEVKKEVSQAIQEFEKEESEDLGSSELQAKALLQEGEKFFDAKEYENALKNFRKSRELDPEPLPPWFYEIRTLSLMNRMDEAKKAAQELAQRRPELGNLPMIKNLMTSHVAPGLQP